MKIDIRDLDFYYGKAHALKRRQPRRARERGDRDHRSFGLRQVDAAAHHQPHLRALSRAARRPARSSSTAQRARARLSAVGSSPPRRHGVPEADAVRLVDPQQRRFRALLLRAALEGRARRPHRGRAATGGAVGRGQGQARPAARLSLSGGQQQRLCIARAIAVRPGDPAARRGDLGARPDLDRQDRGADPRAPRALHDRHRHPQHAAGRPRVAAHRLLPPRRADRVRGHQRDLHQPARAADPGTILPAATADRRRPCSKPRTYAQGLRRGSRPAARAHQPDGRACRACDRRGDALPDAARRRGRRRRSSRTTASSMRSRSRPNAGPSS